MPIPLEQAAERVTKEMRWARREEAGFRVVCERLGLDAEEVDAAVVKIAESPGGIGDEALILHGILVGAVSQMGEPT